MWNIIFVVTFLTFLDDTHSSCEDRNALFSVNATASRDRTTWVKISGNFYLLDNYIAIDINEANVTDLCEGMIKNFPILESLSMINVNLSRIQPNSFQNVPQLKRLSLAVNKLSKIPRDCFNNIPSLEVVFLSGNEIWDIEENAFANMLHLREVHLDRNKLTALNGNIFYGSPQINILDFKFNNITQLSKVAFEDISPGNNKTITIFLSKNNIDDIYELNFDFINPVHLHLEGNRIEQLSTLFYNLKEGSTLYLNDNNIACVSDDVVEITLRSEKVLYILNNPINCDCLNIIDNTFEEKMPEKVRLYYNSTFNCQLADGINY